MMEYDNPYPFLFPGIVILPRYDDYYYAIDEFKWFYKGELENVPIYVFIISCIKYFNNGVIDVTCGISYMTTSFHIEKTIFPKVDIDSIKAVLESSRPKRCDNAWSRRRHLVAMW